MGATLHKLSQERATRRLLSPKTKRNTHGRCERISWSPVNAGDTWSYRSNARIEVVLSLVIIAIGQVIECQTQLDSAANRPGKTQVKDRVTRRNNGRVLANQPVMVDRPHFDQPVPTMPRCEDQPGVRHKVRRAVHINTVIASSIKGVADFRQSAIQRKMTR